MDEIPECVINALAGVREEGRYNMFDRTNVIIEAGFYDKDAEYWLTENKSRYGEALIAMGNRISEDNT
jgi:hypothetical protein